MYAAGSSRTGWNRASAGIDVTNVMRNSTPKIRAAFWSELTATPFSSWTAPILSGIETATQAGRADDVCRRFQELAQAEGGTTPHPTLGPVGTDLAEKAMRVSCALRLRPLIMRACGRGAAG